MYAERFGSPATNLHCRVIKRPDSCAALSDATGQSYRLRRGNIPRDPLEGPLAIVIARRKFIAVFAGADLVEARWKEGYSMVAADGSSASV
jgi:hypothetical protein